LDVLQLGTAPPCYGLHDTINPINPVFKAEMLQIGAVARPQGGGHNPISPITQPIFRRMVADVQSLQQWAGSVL